MPVGQLIYFNVEGETTIKCNEKKNAKYSGQPDKPVESDVEECVLIGWIRY
jgi:dCTP deaminase